jgi:hypothetical protein
MRALLAGLLLFGIVSGVAGCHDGPDRLWITQIEVLGESDGLTRLDIEVHLFDMASRAHLGCSSLESVDESGTLYDVEGFFTDMSGRRVEPADLFGRDVVIEVIEDDVEPCPAPPDIAGGDDPVGTSGPIFGEDLGLTGPLSFENVAVLELALYP